MGETILIADSGGTKTDWCAIIGDQRLYFETQSCHPSNWNESFWDQLEKELGKNLNLASVHLYFFGAGCLNPDNNSIATTAFRKMSFKSVHVLSDLHGAGYALFGKENGVGIISGTGSVLFHWVNEEIVHRVGGKGHAEGDEGSGFYFGKLVKEKWEAQSLSTEQQNILTKSGLNVLTSLQGKNEKFVLASLSKILVDDAFIFANLHEENIRGFVETHLKDQKPSQVSILGGYGFAHKVVWGAILRENSIELTVSLERPIVSLVEQMDSFVD